MSAQEMDIPLRCFQISQLYGPGMPAGCKEGYREEQLTRPAGQVGLVLVHCWNLGEPDGPYPIGDDARPKDEASDWVIRAHQIIKQEISPVLATARRAGVTVFHLAQHRYAPKYASYQAIAADDELKGPTVEPVAGCVRPQSVEELWQKQYGKGYPGPVWVTDADKFDIARAVRPVGDEPVVVDGWQINGLCRRLGIDTLFYAGFMADLCLVNIPGAIREMVNRFGYRCVALRECTTAYEYADTAEGGWMTRAVIRHIETDLGYSASASGFISAFEGKP